jgi:2'-5' RNA ligase
LPRREIGVAIGIPEPLRSYLQEARERFGDPEASAIPPHVTLLPPTAIRAEALPLVEQHLATVAAAYQPFEIELRGSGTFRPISPVVFVVLVRGISDCERLAAAVRAGPLSRPLHFPYHPHVTVAHDLPEPALDRAFDEFVRYEARFPVSSFELYERDGHGVWRPQLDFTLDGRGYTGRSTAPADI